MKTWIWIIVGLAAIGGLVYFFWFKGGSNDELAKQIKDLGAVSGDVSGAEKAYLKAWLKAIKKEKKTFSYQGATYSAIGGTKITGNDGIGPE